MGTRQKTGSPSHYLSMSRNIVSRIVKYEFGKVSTKNQNKISKYLKTNFKVWREDMAGQVFSISWAKEIVVICQQCLKSRVRLRDCTNSTLCILIQPLFLDSCTMQDKTNSFVSFLQNRQNDQFNKFFWRFFLILPAANLLQCNEESSFPVISNSHWLSQNQRKSFSFSHFPFWLKNIVVNNAFAVEKQRTLEAFEWRNQIEMHFSGSLIDQGKNSTI